MGTLFIAVLSFVGFIIAYHTYGKWLARRIFRLDPSAQAPSHSCQDGKDFVPTNRYILFGHHFTSIAGTGPIVGPAIAVLWGWLPALLWVLLGSVFLGAVHDFGVLVVSMRNQGQSVGDISGIMITRRSRFLFLAILFFTLTVVIAVFGLVIATIFSLYPETVLSVWTAMPLAVCVGYLIYRRGANLLLVSIGVLLVLYGTVYLGVRFFPVDFGLPLTAGAGAAFWAGLHASVVLWTLLLLVYCFVASVLPVWLLLQPRDYINSLQLYVALALLSFGLFVAVPPLVAPAYSGTVPGAPPIMPFLFITIACGAISGFHCMVSSGTSSKQIDNETDAQYIGYGGMLMEGMLAVLVILACCAGIGIAVSSEGTLLQGRDAFLHYYGKGWAEMRLAHTIGAFVQGGGNIIAALGIPRDISVGIIAVMVACFAATTIDTAARLQRYVIQEIGSALRIPVVQNKYVATTIAVVAAGSLALMNGPTGPGSGGLILWPLFGATNQLLAGLALLVVVFYLRRTGRPVFFVIIPLLMMLLFPAWALMRQVREFYTENKMLLTGIGATILALQAWMILEALTAWAGMGKRERSAATEAVPPETA